MIYFEEYEINAADLGDCNPLPDIKNVTYIHAKYTLTERVTKEESADFGKGMINTMLPYMLQDGYNRDRKKKKFNAVRLENKYLRAIFLPELGGRLWSLYDKEGKRELLYKNSVFQPANLALRNAWFSGGIEFNVAIKGHNPLTCSRLFAEIICCNGEEVLRMYEFERIREITYSICAFLPEDSRVLYIKDCIENTSDDEKYSYWWSNIAVPESPRIRVIVPASEAYLSSYNEGNYVVDKIPVPVNNGKDLSYPNNSPRSQDFFYKIPDHAPKWIAAVGDDGRGIIQFSQQRMIGRKLFVWGQGKGGRNWNEWLSEKGESYVEIQAGLSRTQLEHIPMKAHECWEWVEAYGAVNCDREAVHSSNWLKAQNAVKSAFGDSLDAEIIEKRLSEVFPDLSVGRRKLLCCGSGWGALENKLRVLENNPPISADCDFPEKSLDCEQEPWLYLLEHGVFPDIAPEVTPVSYVSGRKWSPLLENAIRCSGGQQWYAWMQYGVYLYETGDTDGAEKAWKNSVALKESAWAWRNLAMLYKNEYKKPKDAIRCIKNAVGLNRDCRGIVLDFARIYIQNDCDSEWVDFYGTLSERLQNDGRIRLYLAVALMHLNRIEDACDILNEHFMMCDIEEGEISLTHIWKQLYTMKLKEETGITDQAVLEERTAQIYPIPNRLNFSMHE